MNIIAIYNRDKKCAIKEFASFMAKVTDYMNEQVAKGKNYKSYDGRKLEGAVVEAMKTCCTGTPFTESDIELVSGQRFPDIVAAQHFGVEVKSTKEDKWTSTGSSIVESTRVPNLDRIFMLFGKLGGTCVAFKSKPYQECLSDIAVTHAPRYLIDMNLSVDQTIFAKMGVDYDDFRQSKDSINIARQYYIDKAAKEHKTEMPWWLSQDTTVPPTLKLWAKGTFTIEEQRLLKAKMLILFGSEICQSNYHNATLWLCSRMGIINANIRDTMSAGGQFEYKGEKYPHIIKVLFELKPYIQQIITAEDFELDLSNYAPVLYKTPKAQRFDVWKEKITQSLPNENVIKELI